MVEQTVRAIIDDVRTRGDTALFEYTQKFDGAALDTLRVSEAEIDAAYAQMDKDFITTLEMARDNIEAFHRRQLREGFEIRNADGTILGQRITPIERVGVYVPGGTAAYPSTVLMNVIPARLAGVSEIVMVTPPNSDGTVNPAILAAAKVAGAAKIFKVGGAQAIAALAYGTDSIPKVDKIVGPGNIYVATAKRMVFGTVDIDMIAGPSEITVIADDTANPQYVAADMLSQLEHDKLAQAVLYTTDAELAAKVKIEIDRQVATLSRQDILKESIANYRIIVAETLESAVELSNAAAPEHLELCVAEPFVLLEKVTNAGSVFLGHHTPEALGDYFAGPNHTLPTGGTARFSSPLGVDDFVKRSSYIYYPEDALRLCGGRVADFAAREGLDGHARSVTIRNEQISN